MKFQHDFSKKIKFFEISLLKLEKNFRRCIFEIMKNISNNISILKFNLKHNNDKLTLIKTFKTKRRKKLKVHFESKKIKFETIECKLLRSWMNFSKSLANYVIKLWIILLLLCIRALLTWKNIFCLMNTCWRNESI